MKLTVAWRIMRLTTLFILITALHLSAKTTAQKITLSASGITISQFFDQLSKQTGFSFLLGDGTVPTEQKINVHVTEMSLEDVLDQILKPCL
ncbi:MAG: STN domain-containing protein [Puia sp.]